MLDKNTLEVTRLDTKPPEGDCPRCGINPSYPYLIRGFDGYIDSCPDCKLDSAYDAVLDSLCED